MASNLAASPSSRPISGLRPSSGVLQEKTLASIGVAVLLQFLGGRHRTELPANAIESKEGRVVTLPEAELSFYFAAPAQLEPSPWPVFTERVTWLLGAHPNPGPGETAPSVGLVGLWTPPTIEEFQRRPRWDRATPAFERVSKRAW